MLIRKNVSLDETHLQKLQPLLEKHKGNLSAAIREAIDLVSPDLENYGTPEETDKKLIKERKSQAAKEELFRSEESVTMNQQMMKWLVRNCAGKLMDEDVIHGFINPYIITTLPELEEHLNRSSKKMDWKIEVSGPRREDAENGPAIMDFTGGDRDFREFLLEAVCIFLSRWMNLDVEALHRKSNSVTVYLQPFLRQEPEEAATGVRKHFGSRDFFYRELEKRPQFWITLAELYAKFNYRRVNLDKDLFKALIAGEVPDITKYFEIKADRSLREIPLSELLPLFKYLVTTSQLVNDVEICTEKGKEYIKIRHDYSDERVIEKMIQLFSSVFEAGWHKFNLSSVSELIIFNFSSSDISNEKTD
ncbi:hypothetical protein EQO05_01945 [Methanosarcina sp. MSH10X1]|uniref:hypothetical protein n=1 Tax=Methanosarcina sp. MSH10X1 TaxID=2507075 RepID=UPI000FFC28B2|nr:hypothetical protein [Methanosarcina sp. MSH10X1]RXA21447.1 hypothetical protein EQO05_01945 [Methanosarcina sp. MSH10X1]